MLLNKFKKIYTHRRPWGKNRIGPIKKHQGTIRNHSLHPVTFAQSSKISKIQIKIWPAEAGGGIVATQ